MTADSMHRFHTTKTHTKKKNQTEGQWAAWPCCVNFCNFLTQSSLAKQNFKSIVKAFAFFSLVLTLKLTLQLTLGLTN